MTIVTLVRPLVTLLRYMRRFGLLKGPQIFFKARLGRSEEEVTFKIRGFKAPVVMRAQTSDRHMFDGIFVDREYAVELDISPRVIIDGGANVGYATLFFAQRYPQATIVAVEPEAGNFRLLERNTSAYPNVRRLQKALWSHETLLTIDNPLAVPCVFRVRETDHTDNTVPSVTVEAIMREIGADCVDILKLDVEGAEREMFASPQAHEWLARTTVLMIELHERFRPGCEEAFERAVAQHPFRRMELGENVILVREPKAN